MLGFLIFDKFGQIEFVSKGTESRLGIVEGSLFASRIYDLFVEHHFPEQLNEGTVWVQVKNGRNSLGPIEICINKLDSRSESKKLLFCASIQLFRNSELLSTSRSASLGVEFEADLSFGICELMRCIEMQDPQGGELDGSTQVGRLMNDLVSIFSKIEKPEEVVPVVIEDFTSELFDFYRHFFESNEIGFSTEVLGLDGFIDLPKSRLLYSLMFLLAEVCREGHVEQVTVGVKRNGTSSSEQIRFEMDFQMKRAMKSSFVEPQNKLTTKLVNSMSGSLDVELGKRDSSRIVLKVPISSFEVEKEIRQKNEFLGKRILVVEDNQLNIEILTHFLQEYGFSFDVVENGQEAVDIYEDGKYDLVLMDIMLPVMNGYEATKEIIIKAKAGCAPPIVGVTAKVLHGNDPLCLECGMMEVIHKPIDFKKMKAVLNRVLLGIQNDDSGEDKETSLIPVQRSRDSKEQRKVTFDRNVAEKYLGYMHSENESREDLILQFLSSIRLLLKNIGSSIDGELQAYEVKRFAHSLKGNLGLVGANDMQDLARGLEMAASRNGENFNPAHWLNLLEFAYGDLERSLKHLV